MQHSGFRLVSSSNETPAKYLNEDGSDVMMNVNTDVNVLEEMNENEMSVGEALYETKELVDMYVAGKPSNCHK